ncbi:MAG: aminotransferase class I/II-fold pyridoxal phosphate-dependent enzyme [Oscillospiraceae bacterium]|nr:aminotransferase class I/II-fold pyridoxal phosphate-dependent enzyme [Oscillospiraceae bacterium]MBR4691530.1 aminotransferase class I/II-fold pyridoxal phosphate-dependent enzyme [Oscillospiraceae bacterium]
MEFRDLIAEKVTALRPSGIRKFFDLLETMEGGISLGVGEPDFQTPWHIRDAGVYSLEKGFTKYTPNAGMMALRREISAYMRRRFGLDYDPDGQIIVTVGGSEGIDLSLRMLLEPGDEVIIPTPSFVCYGPLTVMAGGTPVYVETRQEDDFKLTPELLAGALTPKTKALILPYPCNPTGGIMERADLEAVAEILKDREIAVISDEIYAELSYGGKHCSPASIPGLKERTIVVNGFSKAFAMTGWRLGYLCAPRDAIAQMVKIHQFGIMSAPTVSQYAAIEAMKNGDRDIEAMRREYDHRRRFLVRGLREAGLDCYEPRGAFYVFPCIRSTGLSSDEFCERFLMSEKVAAIPGSAFGPGGEGFVRMCYAASMDDLTEALVRLKRFLKTL